MEWWRALVLAADLYVALSVGGWLLLHYLEWSLLHQGPFLGGEGEEIARLHRVVAEYAVLWPAKPRPGRYGELDQRAQEALSRLSLLLAEADRLRLTLGEHTFVRRPLLLILLPFSWPGAFRALRLLIGRRALRRQLRLADAALRDVHGLRESAEQIPFRLRSELQEVVGEVDHLHALLEAEQSQGTLGLDGYTARLDVLGKAAAGALARVEAGAAEVDAHWVQEADETRAAMIEELGEIDAALTQAAASRARAENQIERVRSTLALLSERWAVLKERGASQIELHDELQGIQTQLKGVEQRMANRTLQAYQEVEGLVAALDGELEGVASAVNEMEALIDQSRAAVEGDVQSLAQANTLCEALLREEPLLDMDTSLSLIEKASQAYMEAEQLRGQGTLQSYRATLASSQQAREYLSQAVSRAEQVLEQIGMIREMLTNLSAETIGAWRQRADRLFEELRIFGRHWEAGLAGDVAEAISLLEQVEVDLERMPANIRYERRLRQSELPQALEILRHAQDSLDRAQELVEGLEAELARLVGLRDRAQVALEALVRQRLPELVEASGSMLADRQGRVEALRTRVHGDLQRLSEPGQVHYDEFFESWLPSVVQEIKAIEGDHAQDLDRLRNAVRDSASQLSRAWNRLRKLDPYQRPRPEQDPEALRLDLEEWRAQIDGHRDDPATLQKLAGREALALQQRLDAAYEQIMEGRRSRDALTKEYYRHAQRVRDLRAALEEMARDSRWPRLRWDLSEAERVWNKALALERDSGAADSLVKANNELQQAVNTAQQAEQLYALAEHQVQSALRRLDEEWRAATEAMDAGRALWRQVQQQAANGEPVEDRVEIVGELCEEAGRALQEAQEGATFEETLRRLREATNLLARV